MSRTFRISGLRSGALTLLCIAIPVSAADASASGRFTVGDYLDLQSARDPQISPDGTQVVYTRTMVDKMADTMQSAVWIVDTDGQHHRFIAKGSGAVWSPDGKSIAYLAEGQPKGVQIFVMHLTVPGPATQITWGAEAPANLHWSPDGHRIGYTMMVLNPEKWTVELPGAPEGAHWASAPRFTERLHYRQDGVGFTERGFDTCLSWQRTEAHRGRSPPATGASAKACTNTSTPWIGPSPRTDAPPS